MNNLDQIDPKFFPSISRVFSPIVLDHLTSHGYSDYLAEVSVNSGLSKLIEPSISLRDFLNQIYAVLFTKYRNEYIYKNTIAKKILLGKHSLNTTHLLTEFRVGKNKADVVLINGTSSVYEIKTEYDSFNRLQNQIQSYSKVFDLVNVLTSQSQLEKITVLLPESVGILVLTDRNTISTIRKPLSNLNNFNPKIAFSSLRKNEYLKIIFSHYGYIPDLPNTLIFEECQKLFCAIPIDKLHGLFINVLKERKRSNLLEDFIVNAPSSLFAYVLSIGDQEKKIEKLMALLDKDFDSLIKAKIS